MSCDGRLYSCSPGNEILCSKMSFSSVENEEIFRWLYSVVVYFSVIARKKLEQVENGGCDREGSSMGSRSSSSGTLSTSNNLNNTVLMLKVRMIDSF